MQLEYWLMLDWAPQSHVLFHWICRHWRSYRLRSGCAPRALFLAPWAVSLGVKWGTLTVLGVFVGLTVGSFRDTIPHFLQMCVFFVFVLSEQNWPSKSRNEWNSHRFVLKITSTLSHSCKSTWHTYTFCTVLSVEAWLSGFFIFTQHEYPAGFEQRREMTGAVAWLVSFINSLVYRLRVLLSLVLVSTINVSPLVTPFLFNSGKIKSPFRRYFIISWQDK